MAMTDPTAPVLVVGGGIGGLAAALALARAGHAVHVAERAHEFQEVGAGLQLAPNATRALAQLLPLERIAQHAVCPKRLVMMDAQSGLQITSLDLGEPFRHRYGAPYLVLHRHDLLTELLASCRESDRITLATGAEVSAIRPAEGGADVTYADGTTRRCRAVIGADGLNSVVRRLVADDRPLGSGYVAYRGPVPIDRVGGDAQTENVLVWVGPGLHLVQYPLRGGALYNQVAVFRSDRYDPDVDASTWGTPDELTARFSPMCAPVSSAIGLLDQGMRWPMYDRAPIDNWTDGPVTLLGDAAHPMLQYLAQGACQALEDAVCLSRCYPPGRDPHDAFLAYQRERIPRTARVQRTARRWGELWHLDGVAREVRNAHLALRAPADYTETDWLYERGHGEA